MVVEIFKRIESPFIMTLKQISLKYGFNILETRKPGSSRIVSKNDFIKILDKKYPGLKQDFDLLYKQIKG